MTPEQAFIVARIVAYLKTHRNKSFAEALYDLDINQMYVGDYPGSDKSLLRDIYKDSDEKIIERLKRSQ